MCIIKHHLAVRFGITLLNLVAEKHIVCCTAKLDLLVGLLISRNYAACAMLHHAAYSLICAVISATLQVHSLITWCCWQKIADFSAAISGP